MRGKRALVHVDLNVPVENGMVADPTRIERVAPTIREIADQGGKVILLSHFGRPAEARIASFLKGLAELGWVEGRNVRIRISLGTIFVTPLPFAFKISPAGVRWRRERTYPREYLLSSC